MNFRSQVHAGVCWFGTGAGTSSAASYGANPGQVSEGEHVCWQVVELVWKQAARQQAGWKQVAVRSVLNKVPQHKLTQAPTRSPHSVLWWGRCCGVVRKCSFAGLACGVDMLSFRVAAATVLPGVRRHFDVLCLLMWQSFSHDATLSTRRQNCQISLNTSGFIRVHAHMRLLKHS